MKKRLLHKALFALLILMLNLTSIGQTFAVSSVKQYIFSPASVHFAVIGDYGFAGQAELDVADQVKSWNPDFIVTVGDNNYDSGSAGTIDANIGQYLSRFYFPLYWLVWSRCGNKQFFSCPWQSRLGYSKRPAV